MYTILVLSLLFPMTPKKLDPALRAEVEARISIIEEWARDPTIVAAVREANEHPRSMEEIARIDEDWQSAAGVSPFMRALIQHPAAERLRELRSSHPELDEAFVTDRLGANVASTNKTSDFYQGDEDKFVQAFRGGKGGLHVGEIVRDESSQSYSVPVAVPVMDDGAAIGVLVVMVNVEKLTRK